MQPCVMRQIRTEQYRMRSRLEARFGLLVPHTRLRADDTRQSPLDAISHGSISWQVVCVPYRFRVLYNRGAIDTTACCQCSSGERIARRSFVRRQSRYAGWRERRRRHCPPKSSVRTVWRLLSLPFSASTSLHISLVHSVLHHYFTPWLPLPSSSTADMR